MDTEQRYVKYNLGVFNFYIFFFEVNNIPHSIK